MEGETFGAVVKRRRLEKGFSLRELARRVKMPSSYSHLWQVERGEGTVSEETIQKLADELGEPVDRLLQLAGKVSKDVRQAILESERASAFLRTARKLRLSDADWDELIRHMEELTVCKGKSVAVDPRITK